MQVDMAILVGIVVTILSMNGVGVGVAAAKKNSAFFIFGDSTVDPGNNNYIQTIPENQANYKPYGQNGFFKNPTGRFSDGRIIVDYLGTVHVIKIIDFWLIYI